MKKKKGAGWQFACAEQAKLKKKNIRLLENEMEAAHDVIYNPSDEPRVCVRVCECVCVRV